MKASSFEKDFGRPFVEIHDFSNKCVSVLMSVGQDTTIISYCFAGKRCPNPERNHHWPKCHHNWIHPNRSSSHCICLSYHHRTIRCFCIHCCSHQRKKTVSRGMTHFFFINLKCCFLLQFPFFAIVYHLTAANAIHILLQLTTVLPIMLFDVSYLIVSVSHLTHVFRVTKSRPIDSGIKSDRTESWSQSKPLYILLFSWQSIDLLSLFVPAFYLCSRQKEFILYRVSSGFISIL